ncbi:wall-associated receptor kinase-like 14 [Macadamia integrifolia]|uniref:wall-associated receptor kinase-like 14 n=1 Tax=Macadamia integrifolia TaxID=60698 RepID=UPI001C4F3386|nr:wall-associated receptor kinase-like 14 [Macadamia integrifolia]
MILNNRNLVLPFVIFVLASSAAHALNSSCNQSCGNNQKNRLPFPFGFSDGCEIRLNCSAEGEIYIGDFPVQKVTTDNIVVSVPAQCNRSIEPLRQLFHTNYALTWKNGILLYHCHPQISGCLISPMLVEDSFGMKTCEPKHENLSCLAKTGKSDGFMTFDYVNQSNCGFLFSAVAVDSNVNSSLSLEFQTVQLGWWLEGQCQCSQNANCTTITSPYTGKPGFRCRCNDGFEGDGFNAGLGCRKVLSRCNPSKYMSGQCGGTTRVAVLVGGLVAGASLMAGLAFICYFIRQRSTFLKTRKSTKRLLSEAAGNFSIPFYPYKEIEKATNCFAEKQRLGTGAYGTVYAGKLHNEEWVAIKKLRHRDTDGIEQVMNEIKLLSSVSHPNLVRLLGCCIERDEQILVYEYMPNGTLSQHLLRERGKGLPWTIRLTIAAETAQAIAHLHSAIYPPIYHRDIKSSNILLDFNFNSKVADFGLSRLGMTEDSHISTAPQGTPGYLDPQYHQNFHLSDKSDVYSFGVVLVEIITALKVVDFSRPHSEVNLAALAIDKIGKGCIDEIIDPFIEPHRDAWTLSSVHKIAELAFRCLAFHRDMRPSMMEVAAELECIRLSGWEPLEDGISDESSIAIASTFSSPQKEIEKSLGVFEMVRSGSRRLLVPQKDESVLQMVVKDSSPVSVQDPWASGQSSPSTNSLLGTCNVLS